MKNTIIFCMEVLSKKFNICHYFYYKLNKYENISPYKIKLLIKQTLVSSFLILNINTSLIINKKLNKFKKKVELLKKEFTELHSNFLYVGFLY